LKELLQNPEFKEVYTLVRRLGATPADPKIREILLTGDNGVDFSKLPSNADVVFSGVGTTIKRAGSQEAFRKVDYDFNAELADAARRLKIPQFHLVSSVGADSSSSFFYLKVKGELEDHIKQLAFPHTGMYRPGFLSEAERPDGRLLESVSLWFMRALTYILPVGPVLKSAPIPVYDVAKVMVADATAFAKNPTATEASPQYRVYDGSDEIAKRLDEIAQRVVGTDAGAGN
jgi:uncharacterized protein YbjT (DUF2867 family)